MKSNQTVPVFDLGAWNNNACRGYVIYAMENCDFKCEDIKRVVKELHWVFDVKTIEEAEEHYCGSPY